MAVYHFTWDLEFFGYAEPGMTAVGGWKMFARCIASSFLFLTTMLGVRPHADRGELELRHPRLPDWLGRVTLTNLRVGEASVDLLFHRWRGTTSAEVLRKVGDLDVTIRL